ncbi:MAG: MarR family transcriptional regulator [Anaerolineales bacterium]
MRTPGKKVLVRQALEAVRYYNFSNGLFRHTIVEKLGVNITDWEALGLLLQKGVSTPTELSRHTGLTSGATTAMLDRLERSGIIERRRNPEDRRGTLIVIVKEKANELAALFVSARRAQEQLFSGYTEAELEFLADFIGKLANVLDQERLKMQKNIQKDQVAPVDQGY